MIRIGCAGWAIPRQVAAAFPAAGTGLQRYAAVFDAVEINTTFYRPHRAQTFERWASSTPERFRFAVKAPKAITHERRLVDCADLLGAFLEQLAPLDGKLGPMLFQLPPSLAFDADVAGAFFGEVASRHRGPTACEPRHASWFCAAADRLLADHGVARVAADPAVVDEAAEPGGAPSLAYWRLHGSPRIYYSSYPPDALAALAARFAARDDADIWCIFDNTASGAAAADALDLLPRAAAGSPHP